MDQSAFEETARSCYAGLYRFALSLARNPARAADLTQQAFCLLAEKGTQLRDPANARKWLATTLYREFLRECRRDQRFSGPPLEEVSDQLPDLRASNLEQMDAQAAMNALQQLEETYRSPLALFYIEGFSYREIASIIDVPIGTVMSRLARGKAQLRALLSDQADRTTIIPLPRADLGS